MLGIDLGRSRTGLALSDPLGLICSPLETLVEKDEESLIERITAVVDERDVAEVVLGLPRPLSGHTNEQLESVLAFGERLERALLVPVRTWDERFTSRLAGGKAANPAGEDAVAASYMLQNYLDSRTDTTRDEVADEY